MDVAKEPVIGASVVVMGSTNGCITDFDGKMCIRDRFGTAYIEIYILPVMICLF